MKERKQLASLLMWILLLVPLVAVCYPISELSGGSSVDIQIDKGCDSRYRVGDRIIISFKVTSQKPNAIVTVIRYTPNKRKEYLIRDEVFCTNQVHSYQELVRGPEGEYCLMIIATAEASLIAECHYFVIERTSQMPRPTLTPSPTTIPSETPPPLTLTPPPSIKPTTPPPIPYLTSFPSTESEPTPFQPSHFKIFQMYFVLLGLLVSIAILVVLFIMYRDLEPEYPDEDVHLDEDKDVRKW